MSFAANVGWKVSVFDKRIVPLYGSDNNLIEKRRLTDDRQRNGVYITCIGA